jgi:hypothetical protein
MSQVCTWNLDHPALSLEHPSLSLKSNISLKSLLIGTYTNKYLGYIDSWDGQAHQIVKDKKLMSEVNYIQ